jgi:hypothetical protein
MKKNVIFLSLIAVVFVSISLAAHIYGSRQVEKERSEAIRSLEYQVKQIGLEISHKQDLCMENGIKIPSIVILKTYDDKLKQLEYTLREKQRYLEEIEEKLDKVKDLKIPNDLLGSEYIEDDNGGTITMTMRWSDGIDRKISLRHRSRSEKLTEWYANVDIPQGFFPPEYGRLKGWSYLPGGGLQVVFENKTLKVMEIGSFANSRYQQEIDKKLANPKITEDEKGWLRTEKKMSPCLIMVFQGKLICFPEYFEEVDYLYFKKDGALAGFYRINHDKQHTVNKLWIGKKGEKGFII